MAEDILRGKNIELVAKDIAEGYVFINPIFLKRFDEDTLKKLLTAMNKTMILIRNAKFPTGDTDAIKQRNMRLSRLNNALTVMKHFAKQKKWIVF